jgi:HK97 family phage major capsid protein
MSDVANRLQTRRQNVWSEARAIVEGAAEANRDMTPDEQGTWEAMMEELDKIDERMTGILAAEERSAKADAAFDRINGTPATTRITGSGSQQVGQRLDTRGGGDDAMAELRAFLRGDSGAPKSFEIRPNPDRPTNYRTLSNLTTGAGGNLMPTDWYDQLIAHLIEVSGVMQAGPTVLNTAGGETLQIPKTTSHSSAASAAAAGNIGQSDPAFGLSTLSAYKYGILVQVARELIDDSGVDLIGYLAMQCGRAIGNKFGSDLVTGTGAAQPTGFLGSATVGVTGTVTGVSGAPTYSNLVDMEYSVIAPYRQSRSCYWIAQDKTIGSFRKILDAQNRPIWEPSMVLGSPDLLLGKPLVADPFMPAVAAAGGTYPIAFGDFSQFFVRLVGPVRFERSDDFLFGSDLVAFRCVLRGDGTLVDLTGAIKKFQCSAT